MNFKVLRAKNFNNGKFWLLAELNLKEYVESLSEENFNFEVQRKIVKNRYLDSLLNTIESQEPLPNITLAYHNSLKNVSENDTLNLKDSQLDILDGLQRTYRLWAFWRIYKEISSSRYKNVREAILGNKKKYPDFFENGIVDSKFFKSNFPDGTTPVNYDKSYGDYTLYFTIWSNLSESELVQKMLILNAGHKAVSTQHQFEILFLNLWKSINDKNKNIKIVREKERDFNQIKRGNRQVGEYLFSSVITSLMSLVLAKPQRISSEMIYRYDLIQENEENSSLQYAEKIFQSDFIRSLLQHLYTLDKEIQKTQKEEGVSWFGKDTTLNGIFAGVGYHLNLNSQENYNYNIEKNVLQSFEKLKSTLPINLNLKKFNIQYDNLTGRSVNIGNLIRTVVMKYTLNCLNGVPSSWETLFNEETRG